MRNPSTIGMPLASVREIETKDGAVLLDIQGGQCLSMNCLGSSIWQSIRVRHSREEILARLAEEYPGVSREQIIADLARFIDQLTALGVLLHNGENAGSSDQPRIARWLTSWHFQPQFLVGRLLFWKALSYLLFFDLFGFHANFARTHTLIEQWEVRPIAHSKDVLEKVTRAVAYACIWYPKRVLCLQRSAVLTCLLRSCGISAQFVVGAQKCPFKAHAWTEVDGRAINELRDVRQAYLIWDRC